MSGMSDVDDYLAKQPEEVRRRLSRIRELLRQAAPHATETVRYGMPAVMFGGVYGVHFAGWKKHIALYPVPVFDADLEAEVAPYRNSKDGVAFRHDKPLPEDLIARMCRAISAIRIEQSRSAE